MLIRDFKLSFRFAFYQFSRSNFFPNMWQITRYNKIMRNIRLHSAIFFCIHLKHRVFQSVVLKFYDNCFFFFFFHELYYVMALDQRVFSCRINAAIAAYLVWLKFLLRKKIHGTLFVWKLIDDFTLLSPVMVFAKTMSVQVRNQIFRNGYHRLGTPRGLGTKRSTAGGLGTKAGGFSCFFF